MTANEPGQIANASLDFPKTNGEEMNALHSLIVLKKEESRDKQVFPLRIKFQV